MQLIGLGEIGDQGPELEQLGLVLTKAADADVNAPTARPIKRIVPKTAFFIAKLPKFQSGAYRLLSYRHMYHLKFKVQIETYRSPNALWAYYFAFESTQKLKVAG
jgi:hypothetical protein